MKYFTQISDGAKYWVAVKNGIEGKGKTMLDAQWDLLKKTGWK